MSAPPAERTYTPVVLGPTWQRHDDGTFVLPQYTLGWHVLGWSADNLLGPDGGPWTYTDEQARFVLHWYAINERGRFVWRDGLLQRLKGWGKDPLVATLALVELCGPCRFGGWDGDGEPIAVEHEAAWIQVAAVSLPQTRTTFTLFASLISPAMKRRHKVELGKEIVYAHHGQRRIEAVTSSPRALEGGRPTLVIKNEGQHWLGNNEGHEMAAVIDRNAAKSADGSARVLAITNAYEPSEDSDAQRTREAYEEAVANGWNLGLLYDSLEAPPEAPLTPEAAPAVVEAIKGDAWWLDTERIAASIADRRNPPSRSRRFWYNQIVAAEDAWSDPLKFDLCRAGDDVPPLAPRDEIAVFFDAAKSDDATGLVCVRIRDGYVATLGMWQRPPGARGKGWTVPRAVVDQRVTDVCETYQVVAFFADPSHAKDDETQERYWDALLDDWHRRYHSRLALWADPGKRGHSVLWDMTSPQRTAQFTAAAERTTTDIDEGNLIHDGDGRLRTHVRNARRVPNRYGVSLGKLHRESDRKVDLAVCMVGARMARRMLLNDPDRKRQRTGVVW